MFTKIIPILRLVRGEIIKLCFQHPENFSVSMEVLLLKLQRANKVLFISSAVFSGTFAPYIRSHVPSLLYSTEVYLVPRDPAVVFVIFFIYLWLFLILCFFLNFFHYVRLVIINFFFLYK